MKLVIDDLLDAHTVQYFLNGFEECEMIDGKLTAGLMAKQVKNNQQLDANSDIYEELSSEMLLHLKNNQLFSVSTLPKTIHSLIFSRTAEGNYYGSHVDNAIMNGKRSDVSFTIFLSNPSDYHGGELIIENEKYKLPAGSMIVYPSSTLHQVAPVTSGTRYVCCGWVHSYVRNPQHRELLFELDTAKLSLYNKVGKCEEIDLLLKTHTNLFREWAEC